MKVAAVSDVAPNKELFLNRELGVLAFNRRVLAMAEDESVPLLERCQNCPLQNTPLPQIGP